MNIVQNLSKNVVSVAETSESSLFARLIFTGIRNEKDLVWLLETGSLQYPEQ